MNIKKTAAFILSLTLIFGILPVYAVGGDGAKYEGKGMRIAVLERGFALTHESFTLTHDPSFTKSESDKLLPYTNAYKTGGIDSLYVSGKIPFAYDYGDNDADLTNKSYSGNGNAAISVASGNGKLLENNVPGATGIAPEAQILAMKVYSDTAGDITPSAVVAAIDDAVTLGADVILMTMVRYGGFGSSDADKAVADAVARATKKGIIVIAPSGEADGYGLGGVYDREYGGVEAPTWMPDTGTISFPGSLPDVFTVGSSDANTVSTEYFTLPDGTCIPYGDANYMFPDIIGEKTLAEHFGAATFEYVIIGGLGREEDFEKAPDLKGKFAVVDRGEISFADKVTNAEKHGAVGVIVVDPQPDHAYALTVSMDLTGAKIPAVIVSTYSGAALKHASDKKITTHPGEAYITKTKNTPTPASLSAVGTTARLSLKPDITAVGSNVVCADADGTYGYITSPIASTATIAGMCACVKERLTVTTELTGQALAEAVKAVLCGTSMLMEQDAYTVYSPRVQGAGNARLSSALSTGLMLTSNGSHKLEAGDGHTRIIKMSVTAANLSDTPKACTLSAIVGSDGYISYTYGELENGETAVPLYTRLGKDADDTVSFIRGRRQFDNAKITLGDALFELNERSETYEPYTFTLGSGESVTFNVTVHLDYDTYKEYTAHFENGFFIDGFVKLACDDESVHIPFAGFSGDFAAAPSADTDLYDGGTAFYSGSYLYRNFYDKALPDVFTLTLGADRLFDSNNDSGLDRSALYFSPKADPDNSMVMLNFGLLRDVFDVNITVTDESGEVVSRRNIGDVHRTYPSARTGNVTSAQLPIWNGRDAKVRTYIYPDGIYTAEIAYKILGTGETQKLTYRLILDTEKPTLASTDFFMDGDIPLLKVNAEDNNTVKSVSVIGASVSETDPTVFYIGNLTGKYIYIDIYDAAANITTARIENPLHSSES